MATQTLERMIITNPQLRGERPIISGTGVTVRTVVGHYKLGLAAEEIADDIGVSFGHFSASVVEIIGCKICE